MGQRHQVYVVMSDEKKGREIIGIHHQWLYGHTAIRMAERFLTFVEKARTGTSHPFVSTFGSSPIDVLSAIYSCDVDEGYFHGVHVLDDGEPEDPRRGDNNDGITVFDLRGLKKIRSGNTWRGRYRGSISYCFANLYEREGRPAPFQPLSARQYCRQYYPEHVEEIRTPGFKIVRDAKGDLNEPENRVRKLERLRIAVTSSKTLHDIWPEVFPAPAPPRPALRLVLPELGDSP